MEKESKKQFSLSLLMRISLAVVVLASILIFANSVMKYNKLMEQQKELESQLANYQEMREELQELLNSDMDRDYIIRVAKQQLNLYFPDEEIYYNDRND